MDLESIRKKIDSVDEKIVQLLAERTELALAIGRLKDAKGGPVYAPERESEVYQRVCALAPGALPADALRAIYREIMSASLALEQPLKIAYLGPEATFTHIAAIAKFGSSVAYRPLNTIGDVFSEVEKSQADYGVIPIENSTEGAISHSLDMFMDSDLKICSEIITNVSMHLMSSSALKSIRRVYSKPEAFAQCRNWLKGNLPNAELIDTGSTTQAAKRAAAEEGSAAIASRLAATYYNLEILASEIQDSTNNRTRFLVIGRHIAKRTGCDKTSIMVSVKDKVGALYELLAPIRQNRINMTKIESRPSRQRVWDYFFFIDLEGHAEDPRVKKTLRQIDRRVKLLKILGSYPAASASVYGTPFPSQHRGHPALRAGEAGRGGPAGARPAVGHQARLEREPAGASQVRRAGHPASGASGLALSRRRAVSAEGGPGPAARGEPRLPYFRQRLQ